VEEAEHLRAELRRESLLRKRAHNELRELKGNIRVLCRVRPAAAGVVNERRAANETEDVVLSPHDEFTVLLSTVSKCVPPSSASLFSSGLDPYTTAACAFLLMLCS
jgi:hypothetical protein